MRIYIYIISLILFLISCSERSKEDINKEITIIDLENLSNEDIIKKNIENIDFIKLETNDNCLMNGICVLEIDVKKNRLFILDYNENVFVFNLDGKFINTIGKIGTGPNEQLGIDDIFIDKQNERISLVDKIRSSFFYYSYSGKFLKEEKIEPKIIQKTKQYFHIDKNTMLLTQKNSVESIFNYRIMNINDNEYKDFVPYLAVGKKTVSFSNPKVSDNNSVLMSSFLSDTIYKYDNISNTIIPSYYIKSKLRSANKKDIENNYEMGDEAYRTVRNKGLSPGLSKLLTTNIYISFSYIIDDETYKVFYNTISHTGYCHRLDYSHKYSEWFQGVITSTEDAFVSVISPEDILNLNINEDNSSTTMNDNKLNLLKQKTDEDNNPILVLYKLL